MLSKFNCGPGEWGAMRADRRYFLEQAMGQWWELAMAEEEGALEILSAL